MKIYTRTGDCGETGLFGGPRVSKDDARIEATGTIDELNAFLGVARASGLPGEIEAIVERVQHGLFAVGAEVASPDPIAAKTKMIDDAEITWLEAMIDLNEEGLEPLQNFILPAGTSSAATLHAARGICRRAERRIVTLHRTSAESIGELPLGETIVQYMNRLGDLLFVLARGANSALGVSDHVWKKPGK